MLILIVAYYLASTLLVLAAPLLEEAGITAAAPPEFNMLVHIYSYPGMIFIRQLFPPVEQP